jgi:hypothetical protein
MFILPSTPRETTHCLVAQQCDVREEVHESMTRLLGYAMEATAASKAPVRDWSDLLARLNVSAGAFSNWKRRGISLDGAVAAEREFGCYASWLLDGGSTSGQLPSDVLNAMRHLPQDDAAHLMAVLRTMLKLTPHESGGAQHRQPIAAPAQNLAA